jgi:hypothetical protein
MEVANSAETRDFLRGAVGKIPPLLSDVCMWASVLTWNVSACAYNLTVESLPAPPRPVPSRAAATAPAKTEAAILPPAPPANVQSTAKASAARPDGESGATGCVDTLPPALMTGVVDQNNLASASQSHAPVARTSTDGAHALTTVDAPMLWVAADGEAARDDDGAWDPVYVPNAEVDRTIFRSCKG